MSPLFQSTTRLTRSATLHGVLNSKKLTLSTWFKCADGTGGDMFFAGPSTTARVYLTLSQSTGKITFRLRNAAGTTLYLAETNSAYDDASWHHLVISVNLATPIVTWRIDKSAPTLTVTTAATDGTIDFEGSDQWKIGNIHNNGGTNYNGAFFDFLFKAGEHVDLTDNDVLKLFVSSDGRTASGDLFWQNSGPNPGIKPVGYGVGAPVFNGEKADIYFSNSFQNNQGTAGAFVFSGEFDEATSPRVYRWAAHYDSRERWFDSELTGFSYTRSRTFIEEREGHPKRGLRMGVDERDEHFRQERPADSLNHLLFHDREDDSEEYDR